MIRAEPIPASKRARIEVRGVVQGVGFRPFVYHLAQTLSLAGFVQNTSDGVVIEIEGESSRAASFVARLRQEAPPLAEVEEVRLTDLEPAGEIGFEIRDSLAEEGHFVLVSPDMATCDDCVREFTDPRDRRYGYAFTNCTNCGPRYSIIQDIPYDRPKTTMAAFAMCPACQAEYDDPGDRRFHAQPNACPACGPSLAVRLQVRGDRSEEGQPDSESRTPNPEIATVRRLLDEGRIVAVKGLGGFLLACDAENDAAVRELRRHKRPSDKPFALMACDVAAVEQFCEVSDADRAALTSPRRPIVILPRRPEATISPAVAPGNKTIGLMLPYTPLHHLLFGDRPDAPPAFRALVMTSGNLSEEPIVCSNQEAAERLSPLADAFLFHNRDIYMRVDDSVVRTFEGRERVVRRSRGYAPHPVDLGLDLEEVLACGAELKNTFCLTKGRYAILGQHIGDLENYETLVFFEQTLANLKKLFRVEPRAVAYDLHPRYLSTRYALGLRDLPKTGVQHHHAHIASCMAENGLTGKVIGVALDGTGYGTDGKIWGGEFLLADYAGFERRAHLRYVPLPGGDAAIRQPWRVAVSYLRDTFGENLPPHLALWEEIGSTQTALIQAMLARGINTVETSSCGRLFDAVSSLLGLRHQVSYEGQAAIELEMAAAEGVEERYAFAIEPSDPLQIDFRPVIGAIVKDLDQAHRAGPDRAAVGRISAKFHNTLAAAIVQVCVKLRLADGENRVCLSGGSFQNMVLLRCVLLGLRTRGFEVFLHAKVPPNDGGIALGQAVIASERMRLKML